MKERGVQESNSKSHSLDITEPLGIQLEYSYQVRNQVL